MTRKMPAGRGPAGSAICMRLLTDKSACAIRGRSLVNVNVTEAVATTANARATPPGQRNDASGGGSLGAPWRNRIALSKVA